MPSSRRSHGLRSHGNNDVASTYGQLSRVALQVASDYAQNGTNNNRGTHACGDQRDGTPNRDTSECSDGDHVADAIDSLSDISGVCLNPPSDWILFTEATY